MKHVVDFCIPVVDPLPATLIRDLAVDRLCDGGHGAFLSYLSGAPFHLDRLTSFASIRYTSLEDYDRQIAAIEEARSKEPGKGVSYPLSSREALVPLGTVFPEAFVTLPTRFNLALDTRTGIERLVIDTVPLAPFTVRNAKPVYFLTGREGIVSETDWHHPRIRTTFILPKNAPVDLSSTARHSIETITAFVERYRAQVKAHYA